MSDICLGNSSSGIIEMPIFKKPTINIGNRQDGREKSDSIIDVKPNKVLIQKKLIKYTLVNLKENLIFLENKRLQKNSVSHKKF